MRNQGIRDSPVRTHENFCNKAGFLNIGTIDILHQVIVCCCGGWEGGCVIHYRMFNGIPGLYAQLLTVTTKDFSKYYQMYTGVQN